MTRDEIMNMDGQEICDWLASKGFPFEKAWRSESYQYTTEGDTETIVRWNLPACAFAARDWSIRHGDWSGVLSVNVRLMYPALLEATSPLDWLRAAAIVIAEMEQP